MKQKNKMIALGMMSGTSLDGLDMALCEFERQGSEWNYTIRSAETHPYPEEWRIRLGSMHLTDAQTFWKHHIAYGHYLGIKAKTFLNSSGPVPDLICSHGHTVFHQPESGFTMQAGAGEAIAAETGIPVISDFRAADVALGGQGAPLVPIGDRLLFPAYGVCMNIGGFSNVSFEKKGQRIAFDICPSNIILNRLSSREQKPFDQGGMMARSGKTDHHLLNILHRIPYYALPFPKSLGREWVEDTFWPIIEESKLSTPDLLRTCCEHIAFQIGRSLEELKPTRVLITGGGAHNQFLVETIASHTHHELYTPDSLTVDFKEALVFAFLGVLKWNGLINVLSSVTGSRSNHSGGAVHHLFPSGHTNRKIIPRLTEPSP